MTAANRDAGGSPTTSSESESESDRELVATRVFDAPRELVFKVWTDPSAIGQWWGPRGFTTTTYAMDFRPGGVWRFCMHGPDGVDYQNKITYHEVVEPERIVYQHGGDEESDPVNFKVTVTFEDQGGKTRITMRMIFPTAEARDSVVETYRADVGLIENMDRLGEYVANQGLAARTKTAPPVRELVLVRTFDAPRGLVFKAWTDPIQLARWWGPRGFTNPVCEADARPGGRIRIDMTGPDGVVYPMTGVFHEVVEPERLLFTTNAFEDAQGHSPLEVLITVTFAEREGKTEVTVRAEVVRASPEMAGALAGMDAGWTQSLERLGAELEHGRAEQPTDGAVVVTREFDAPRARVFQAWTESDRLARWFGPKGFTMLACAIDPRPGGVFHYGMKSPDGRAMWGKWVFREVSPPERLVFDFSFSDEAGGTSRNPFNPNWPPEVLSTLTFAEHGGRTTLTMRGIPVNPTEAERAAFESAREAMRIGWTGTLDQLDGYLAQT